MLTSRCQIPVNAKLLYLLRPLPQVPQVPLWETDPVPEPALFQFMEFHIFHNPECSRHIALYK